MSYMLSLLLLCIFYAVTGRLLSREDFTLYFDEYLFDLDTADNTTKCTANIKGLKKRLCVHRKSDGGFTIIYDNIKLDFQNDADWSEINAVWNCNINDKQHRRLYDTYRKYNYYDMFPMPALVQMGNYNPIIGKLKDMMAGRLASGAWRHGYYSQYRKEGRYKGNKFGGRGGYGGRGHGGIPGMRNNDNSAMMGSKMMNPMARMMMKLGRMDIMMKMMHPDSDNDNDNAMADGYGDYYNRRRLQYFLNSMSLKKCVALNGKYGIEICAMYNAVRNKLNVDVKCGRFKKLKKEKRRLFPNKLNKLIKMSVLERIFGVVDNDNNNNKESELYDGIEGNIGYSMWREEVMDWHNFENGQGLNDDVMDENDEFVDYGKYSNFGDFVHYFDTFEFNFNWNGDVYDNNNNNMAQKCGKKLAFFNFKLCSNVTKNDFIVFFKKIDANSNIINNEIINVINYEFEHSLFSFNNEDDWHEIITSYYNNNDGLKTMIKKCNFMYIAKLCVEYDANVMELKSSIQFQNSHKWINGSKKYNLSNIE